VAKLTWSRRKIHSAELATAPQAPRTSAIFHRQLGLRAAVRKR